MHSFTLNGAPVEVSDRHPYLLAALREELGVTSPKDGCAPAAQGGCWVVVLDRQHERIAFGRPENREAGVFGERATPSA